MIIDKVIVLVYDTDKADDKDNYKLKIKITKISMSSLKAEYKDNYKD